MAKCLTIVSVYIITANLLLSELLFFVLDVEHAVEDSGKQAQHTLSLPQLHFEGFEPSPYNKTDARAENNEGLVRLVCSIT